MYLKNIRNIFNSTVISKNTKKTTKTGANFDLTTDSLIEKHETISIKFKSKIKISQFYDLSDPNNGNETKSDIFTWAYSNLTPYIFSSKNMKAFQ